MDMRFGIPLNKFQGMDSTAKYSVFIFQVDLSQLYNFAKFDEVQSEQWLPKRYSVDENPASDQKCSWYRSNVNGLF